MEERQQAGAAGQGGFGRQVKRGPRRAFQRSPFVPGAGSQQVQQFAFREAAAGVIASRKTPAGRALKDYAPHRALPVEALKNWELVGLDRRSGIRQQLEERFPNPGEVQFVAEGGGWWAIRECVRQGIGVGIVPLAVLSSDERGDAKDLVIRKLSRQFAVDDYLIHRRADLSPMQQRVRAALTAAAKQHRQATRQTWNRLDR